MPIAADTEVGISAEGKVVSWSAISDAVRDGREYLSHVGIPSVSGPIRCSGELHRCVPGGETLPNSAADMLPQKLTDVAERGFIRSCAVFRPVPLVHFWLVGSAPLVEPMIGPCVDGKRRVLLPFSV